MEGEINSLAWKQCQEEEEEVDRISGLPDNLIHEIFYFVDIGCAVQTSVLSKRWKNVWMSLPFISTSCAKLIIGKLQDRRLLRESLDSFVTILDKVFELRDESDIHKINLVLFILDDTQVEALNRWILAAINHNVRELKIVILGYHIDSAYEIPYQLLNCESLKSLSFAMFSGIVRSIILPKSMSSPQLRKLQLGGISISNSELQRFFSSCPLMEMVLIQSCDIQINNQRNILIDSHSLHTFRLVNNRHIHLGSPDDFLTYTTKISAPNLKEFECKGLMTEVFSLENLSSIVSANFGMRWRESEIDETADTYSELPAEEKQVFARRMMKFLGAVQKVHHLALSSGFLEVLLEAPGTLYRQPPQLCNLETLELEMRFTRGGLQSIAYLLKISPILRTLILVSKENLPDITDDWEAGFSSTCMFSHLQSVEIREVEGCDNELKFLRFLLKNSMVLENMNLIFRSTSDSHDRGRQLRQFERNLGALPTASSNMKIKFC